MKRAFSACVGLIALLAPVAVHADPIDIEVLHMSYSVAIDFGFPYDLPADPSPTPVTDMEIIDGVAQGAGRADWLTVAATSRSEFLGSPNGLGVSSSADFNLTFATLTDGIATLVVGPAACGTLTSNFGCDLYGGMSHGPYSSGFASLFDVTLNQEIWRYMFGNGACCVVELASGTILSTDDKVNGTFIPLTAFDAGHVYNLHMFVLGDSFQDNTAAGIRVSGLQAVPEPSTMLLLGMGLAGLIAKQVRRRQT